MTTREELDGLIDSLAVQSFCVNGDVRAARAMVAAALDLLFARLRAAEAVLIEADAARIRIGGRQWHAYDTARAKHRAAAKGDAT